MRRDDAPPLTRRGYNRAFVKLFRDFSSTPEPGGVLKASDIYAAIDALESRDPQPVRRNPYDWPRRLM